MVFEKQPDTLLLDLPVKLSRPDYCSAVLLYHQNHGSPVIKKLYLFVAAAAFSGMISCAVFAALVGGRALAQALGAVTLFFGAMVTGFFQWERYRCIQNARRTYGKSKLLGQAAAVQFYQYGVAFLSPTGRDLLLWDEIEGAVENHWGLILYRRNRLIAIPGGGLDQGAVDYLHGLLAVKLQKKYRVRAFMTAFGPVVPPPLPVPLVEEIPLPDVFFQVTAARHNAQGSQRRPGIKWFIGSSLCALGFGALCGALYALFCSSGTSWIITLCGCIVCFLAFQIFAYQENKKDAFLREKEVILRFSPSGLEIQREREKSFIPWQLVNHVEKRPGGFLIEYDGYCTFWIDSGGLTQPESGQSSQALAIELDRILTRYAPSSSRCKA